MSGCSSGAANRSSSVATTMPRVARVTVPPAAATRHFGGNGEGFSFDYPGAWHAAPYKDVPGTFGTAIVFLSNATLHPPCAHSSPRPDVYESKCGLPVNDLAPGEFLVAWGIWSNSGSPVHPNTTINGVRAEVTVEHRENCDAIHGEKAIIAKIRSGQFSHYEMEACLRGPDLERTDALIRRMLQTVQVDG
jgi:hypothetical protein